VILDVKVGPSFRAERVLAQHTQALAVLRAGLNGGAALAVDSVSRTMTWMRSPKSICRPCAAAWALMLCMVDASRSSVSGHIRNTSQNSAQSACAAGEMPPKYSSGPPFCWYGLAGSVVARSKL
jgi:hypothetical protein